jgi:hypothetical protein
VVFAAAHSIGGAFVAAAQVFASAFVCGGVHSLAAAGRSKDELVGDNLTYTQFLLRRRFICC